MSPDRLDAEDPRLTAYVLSELSDDEREAVERALEESAELRREVEQIRAAADRVRRELVAEPALGLSAEQRRRIEERAARTPSRRAWWLAGAAAATAAALILVALRSDRNAGPPPRDVARVAETPARAPGIEEPTPEPEPAVATAPSAVATPASTPAAAPSPSATEAAPSTPAPPPLERAREARGPGRLTGLVTDETGGVIPGATVTATHSRTGVARRTVSDANGVYALPVTEGGDYELEVALAGFKTHRTTLSLAADGTWGLNVQLQVAAIEETVTVAASEPQRLVTSAAVMSAESVANAPSEQVAAVRLEADQLAALRSLGYVNPGADAPSLGGAPPASFDTEAYDRIVDNPFLAVTQNPLSTFSIDVDTASYANVRRFIRQGTLPPKDAVRIEEMVNYFAYDYPAPEDDAPFSASVEVAAAPWEPSHRLVRIGLAGRRVAGEERPRRNLVFLLDVSGSMDEPNKLPLLKESLRLLVPSLDEQDRVAIVVYAGASGLVLPSTPGDQKGEILAALDRLQAGGSTNGGAGIRLAYDTATSHFIPKGTNRVVLATDGDFNVGTTSRGDLTRLIEEKAGSGVFLTVLGFGMGNYKDATLEQLADRGNGNYAYIDTLNEARKVLVNDLDATLVTIAKDVKIQVEFNPAVVGRYRQIGYENRALRAEDFNDDTKDAGEIGAGHRVTALYEIVPAGQDDASPGVDPLKYQQTRRPTHAADTHELLTLKLRYKEPDGDTSRLLSFPVRDPGGAFADASEDFRFAAAVASFGMLLRDSPYKGRSTLDGVLEIAADGLGADRFGYRSEFLDVARAAKALRGE